MTNGKCECAQLDEGDRCSRCVDIKEATEHLNLAVFRLGWVKDLDPDPSEELRRITKELKRKIYRRR